MANNRMSRADPVNTQFILNAFDKSKKLQTKTHYVSQFRNYVKYCINILKVNPFKMPLNPSLISFWIAERTRTSGSTGSLRSWIAMLLWLSELCGYPPTFRSDPMYKSFVTHITKQYPKNSDTRIPFKFSDIHHFCADRSRGCIDFLPMDTLLELLVTQLFFFTMSRPSELLFPNTITKSNIKKGIIFDDLQWDLEQVTIRVRDFKNATTRTLEKFIPIQSTKCTNRHCACRILNPYRVLKLYIQKRGELWENLQKKKRRILITGKHKMSAKQHQIWTQQLENLGMTRKDKVFVDSKGMILRVRHLNNLVATIKESLKYKGNFAPYSLRIGGTSHAANVDINQVKIMRYVGWSTAQLPVAAMRYLRFSMDELKLIPFEMIHKRLKYDVNTLFDPWEKHYSDNY